MLRDRCRAQVSNPIAQIRVRARVRVRVRVRVRSRAWTLPLVL